MTAPSTAPPFSARQRLAIYGTLAPGQVNHHHVADLKGRWRAGRVYGRLLAEGWGAQHGCPGVILDPAGDAVAVQVLESADLPEHWDRLDAFEGPGYRRVVVSVRLDDGETIEASIYELNGG